MGEKNLVNDFTHQIMDQYCEKKTIYANLIETEKKKTVLYS